MLQQSTNVSSQKIQLLGSVQLLTRVNETNPPHMLEKHLNPNCRGSTISATSTLRKQSGT